jgi:hypothetical protein
LLCKASILFSAAASHFPIQGGVRAFILRLRAAGIQSAWISVIAGFRAGACSQIAHCEGYHYSGKKQSEKPVPALFLHIIPINFRIFKCSQARFNVFQKEYFFQENINIRIFTLSCGDLFARIRDNHMDEQEGRSKARRPQLPDKLEQEQPGHGAIA